MDRLTLSLDTMTVRLCAPFLIVLLSCCVRADGEKDYCLKAIKDCFTKAGEGREEICPMEHFLLLCLSHTREVCQLVETHATFLQLIPVYNWSCEALYSIPESARDCQFGKNCTPAFEIFGITDYWGEEMKQILRTDLWCRYWIHNVECELGKAEKCLHSPSDIKDAREKLDKFKAVCGAGTQGSIFTFYSLVAVVLLWTYL